MTYRPPIPTMGHPTQNAAIIALHNAGVEAKDIADQLCISVNSVHRSLTRHRKSLGIVTATRKPQPYVPAVNQCDPLWDMEEDERRDEIRRRAAVAARAARLAA